MPQEDRRNVRIACSVPNGIMIRLSRQGYDDGTGDGVRPMIGDGPPIRLAGPAALHTGVNATSGEGLEPGVTPVDAEWWAKWVDQHKLDPLIVGGYVYELRGDDDDVDAKTGTADDQGLFAT